MPKNYDNIDLLNTNFELQIIAAIQPDFKKDGNKYVFIKGEFPNSIEGYGNTAALAMSDFVRVFFEKEAGKCGRKEIAELKQKLAYTEALLKVTDSILNERQRLLDAIPECPAHGACVPHALEWIEKAKAIIEHKKTQQ